MDKTPPPFLLKRNAYLRKHFRQWFMARRGAKRLSWVRKKMFTFSDFFYPVVASFFPKLMYRYAFFGALNVLLDNVLYIVFFRLWIVRYAREGVVHLGRLAVKGHVLALFMSAPIVIVVGFLMMRYIVFDRSRKERILIQFFKYVAASISSVAINYVFIRLFVELLGFGADFAKIITSILVILYSYFFQTKITFRKPN